MADQFLTPKAGRAGEDICMLIDLAEVIDVPSLKKFLENNDNMDENLEAKFQMAAWFVEEWQKKFKI
jgi:hypothetical protein